MNGKTAANAMYTGRLAKDQKAGKDLQPTIDKMNALIDDYDSSPVLCSVPRPVWWTRWWICP